MAVSGFPVRSSLESKLLGRPAACHIACSCSAAFAVGLAMRQRSALTGIWLAGSHSVKKRVNLYLVVD